MIENFKLAFTTFYQQNILDYLRQLHDYPVKLISTILDIVIVVFLLVKIFQIAKDTRAWQLFKGMLILVVITFLSSLLHLTILNAILTSFMTYGVFVLIVVFQPELRRALEQLGTSKFRRFLGLDKDLETRTKENIYKIVIAATELSKTQTGALIVIEREIKIHDIISTGIEMNCEISPQLLVNIFVPNTPLHDGAVIIRDNKIAAASCMLPLTSDSDVARELGTRHRAAMGISKESDAIVVVVSEETGKISIAKDGTLIADIKEEVLKKILFKNLISNRINNQEKNKAKANENKN